MQRLRRLALGLLVLTGAALAAESPAPLTRAHAHNDYVHTRPLLDALDHGFSSVEADIYLVDGQLLVAHARYQVRPERTLQKLYLDPLRERVQRNGGRVYPGGPRFWLLVEIKDDPATTYPVLRDVLQSYAAMLSRFEGDTIQTNAITVVITGHRPLAALRAEKVRYAGADGLLADLNGGDSASLIPWISENWRTFFSWRGRGEFPAAEKAKLRGYVAEAHRTGRLLRFWNAPDEPVAWRELYDAGVDLLNTDDLAGMQQFLLDRRAAKKTGAAPPAGTTLPPP